MTATIAAHGTSLRQLPPQLAVARCLLCLARMQEEKLKVQLRRLKRYQEFLLSVTSSADDAGNQEVNELLDRWRTHARA